MRISRKGDRWMIESRIIRGRFIWPGLVFYPVLLALMVAAGWFGWEASRIKMEVTSPPLDHGRANFSNFILEVNPNLTPDEVDFILSVSKAASKVSGVKQELLLAIPRRESNFRPEAVSSAGAIGPMQVHPAYWTDATHDLEDGMKAGYRKFIYYYTRENNNVDRALKSYLSGSSDGVPRGKGKRKDREWIEKKRKEAQEYVRDIHDLTARLERGEWATKRLSGQ